MTLSACKITVCGIVSPSAFAVLRLITNSNRVAAAGGGSWECTPGAEPLRALLERLGLGSASVGGAVAVAAARVAVTGPALRRPALGPGVRPRLSPVGVRAPAAFGDRPGGRVVEGAPLRSRASPSQRRLTGAAGGAIVVPGGRKAGVATANARLEFLRSGLGRDHDEVANGGRAV
jgi:hypothetical protein